MASISYLSSSRAHTRSIPIPPTIQPLSFFFVYIYLHTQPLKTSSFKEEEQSDATVSNTTRAPRDSTGSGRHASRRAILVGPQEQNLPVSDLRGHHRVEPLPHRQRPAPPACHPQSSTQK